MSDNSFLNSCKHDKKNFTEKQTRDLFKETVKIITDAGKSIDEVQWVGDVDGKICMTFAEFERQVSGMVYLPRGRCAFAVSDKGPVSYYGDGDTVGLSTRVCPDLIVSAENWFLRRVIHTRMTETEPPRAIGAVYNESPEFWELVKLPTRSSPFIVSNVNHIRLYATDNVPNARNVVVMNADPAKGEGDFIRFEDMERNVLKAKIKSNAPRRHKIGGSF